VVAYLVYVGFAVGGLVATVNGVGQMLRPGYSYNPFAPSWGTPGAGMVFIGALSAWGLWRDWRRYRNARRTSGGSARRLFAAGAAGTVVAAVSIATGFLVPALLGLSVYTIAQLASLKPGTVGDPT
jgi:hypothetical protein